MSSGSPFPLLHITTEYAGNTCYYVVCYVHLAFVERASNVRADSVTIDLENGEYGVNDTTEALASNEACMIC